MVKHQKNADLLPRPWHSTWDTTWYNPAFFLEENWRFGTFWACPTSKPKSHRADGRLAQGGNGWDSLGHDVHWGSLPTGCPLGDPYHYQNVQNPLRSAAGRCSGIFDHLRIPQTVHGAGAAHHAVKWSHKAHHGSKLAKPPPAKCCELDFPWDGMPPIFPCSLHAGGGSDSGQFGVQTLQKKVTFGRIPISLFKYFPDQQKNNVNPAFRNPLDPWSVWLGGIILVDYCYLRTPPNQLLNYWSGVDNVLTPTTCYPSLRFPIATFVRKRSSTGHGTARLLVNSSCWPTTFSPGTACAHLPVAVAANSRHLVPMGLEVLNQCVSCITLKNVIFDNTENVWKIGETANDLLYI